MKLFEKYNRVNLLTTVVMMLITGIIYYQAIRLILVNQKDKDLVVEEQETFDYVKLNHHLPQTFESNDQQITFSLAKPGSVKREFFYTQYFKKHGKAKCKGEYEVGRALVTSVNVADKYYKVLIVESLLETEDLIRLIFIITISVILLLLLVLVIINRLVLNRLWKPFYGIMHELRAFNIADVKPITKLDTTIDEFNELNQAVLTMTTKAQNDYTDLKAFSENASHELLTPIAVINSKLDTLIQTENFSEQQSKLLNDLYSAVSRLGRLNQSLLLLVKIENQMLHDRVTINLLEVVEQLLGQFEEIFQDKDLQLTVDLKEKEIFANRYLVEILISNLISNAIRHNHRDGEINIRLTAESFTISNTGSDVPLPDDKIFTRFHKSSGSEGSGLGLTISRQICENYGFLLTYNFADGRHAFVIDLSGNG